MTNIKTKNHSDAPHKKIIARHRKPLVESPALKAAKPEKKKSSNTGPIIVRLSVGLVFLLAGGFFFFKAQREAELRPRLEAIERQQKMSDATRSYQTILTAADSLSELNEKVEKMTEEVKMDVMMVTGKPIEKPLSDHAGAHPLTHRVPLVETASPGTTEPTPSPARRRAREGRTVDEAGREIPEGMLPPEALERMRKGEQSDTPSPEASSSPAPVSGNVTVDPDVPTMNPDEGSGNDHKPIETMSIAAAGRFVLERSGLIGSRADETRAMAERAKGSLKEADQSRSLTRLGEIRDALKRTADSADSLAQEGSKDFKKAEQATVRVAMLREDFLQRKREAERIAEEKRRADELAARTEKELGWAGAARQAAKENVSSYDFEAALAYLNEETFRYTTDPGKEAIAAEVARYTYLRDWMAFLIESMNAKPFPWGWGSGGSRRDVTGADAVTIQLRGGTAAWADVDIPQMRKFVNHYAGSRELARSVRARQLFASALYFQEAGENALAQEYSQAAVKVDPPLREDAERLID